MSESAMEDLRQRLRAATHWDAEYQGHLSNHLPMALAALQRLGATPARLDDYTARYTQRLHPAPAIEPWPVGAPWRERFGDTWAWPAYRDFFRQWLAHEGTYDVLQQALPYLMQGCGAAAFHGLIRCAYAFESGAPDELADALAYWACRWMDLGPAPAAGGTRGPRAAPALQAQPARLLPALAALPASGAGFIAHRMQAAATGRAAARRLDDVLAQLRLNEGTLPRLARCSAQLYARTGSFTVLHLVTSAEALRMLLPLLDEPGPAVAFYARAWAAGVVAARLQPAAIAARSRPQPLLDWPALAAAAVASDDDHLVKLVDACQQAQAAHGGAPDWQRAASRAVQDAARRGGATRAVPEPAC